MMCRWMRVSDHDEYDDDDDDDDDYAVQLNQ